MSRKQLLTAIAVSSLMVLLLLTSAPMAAAKPARPGPPLDEIVVTVRMDEEVGIRDTVAGRLDVFLWGNPISVYEALEEAEREKLVLVRSTAAFYDIDVNPINDTGVPGVIEVSGGEGGTYRADGLYFNPWAVREIRYALNWLISRKFIVEEILGGSGDAMYSPVAPTEYANATVYEVYQALGLRPEGDPELAESMVEDAISNIKTIWADMGVPYDLRMGADGYWEFFDGTSWKTVEVNFFIRIEDERLYLGRYVAGMIEHYFHFKVNKIEKERGICISEVYYGDPSAYRWDLYTAGWVSMAEWKYPEWSIAQMYAGWYGWMPMGYYGPSELEQLTLDLCYGKVPPEQYWDKIKEAIRLGIQESVRVFVAETWEFFPVNKDRVYNIVAGTRSGLWTMYPLRTATTPDGKLRVAEYSAPGTLFMSPWNPIGGFQDVYSEVLWRYVRDYGDYPDPIAGEPIPIRVTWSIEKGHIPVPPTALKYNATEDTWYEVGSGLVANVSITFNYKFSKWHDGHPMSLADVLYRIPFDLQQIDPTDPLYNWIVDYFFSAGILEYDKSVLGYEIINDTAIRVYGTYVHPVSDAVTADYYLIWPSLPWQVYAAMEYCVCFGGPAYGVTYGFYWWDVDYLGKDYWIDMIVPSHVTDIKAAAQGLKDKTLPNWELFRIHRNFNGLPADVIPTEAEAVAGYEALINWADSHHHVAISNGPYYMDRWDPDLRVMYLKAFRDESYPFDEEYWVKRLEEMGATVLNPGPPTVGPAPPPPTPTWVWYAVGGAIAAIVIIAVAVVVLRKRA